MWNWVALLVFSILAAEGIHLETADMEPGAMLVTLAAFFSWLSILLLPTNSGSRTQTRVVLLWAVMATAGFLTISLSPLYFEPGNRSLHLAGGVLVLVLLFGAMQRLIRVYSSSHTNSMMLFTLITGALFTAPLYLSVVAEATSHQALVDAIIAASPVSYLAGIVGYDYLRSGWFYQHMPYGGIRFNYAATGIMTIGYLIITFVLAGANTLRQRAELRTQ